MSTVYMYEYYTSHSGPKPKVAITPPATCHAKGIAPTKMITYKGGGRGWIAMHTLVNIVRPPTTHHPPGILFV